MFYVFEGVDGCGKSTQAALFANYLRTASASDVVEVREPGGTVLGERIRALVLDPGLGDIGPLSELFLFMAARAALVREVIRPALESGASVVADRFLWSSVVYQGLVGGVGVDPVLSLGRLATDGIEPDLVFVFDVDVEIAVERARRGRSPADRIEARGVEYARRVRDAYLEIARRFPERFVVVDARGAPEDVHTAVRMRANSRLRQARSDGDTL
jgi:dTMP kinase